VYEFVLRSQLLIVYPFFRNLRSYMYPMNGIRSWAPRLSTFCPYKPSSNETHMRYILYQILLILSFFPKRVETEVYVYSTIYSHMRYTSLY